MVTRCIKQCMYTFKQIAMRKRRLKMAASSRDACLESRPDFFPRFYTRLRVPVYVMFWIEYINHMIPSRPANSFHKSHARFCVSAAVRMPSLPSCKVMYFSMIFFRRRVRDDFDRRPTSAYHSCDSWMLMRKVNNVRELYAFDRAFPRGVYFIMHWIWNLIRFFINIRILWYMKMRLKIYV